MYDYPLFPDVATWGHTFTHVVLDNAPKSFYDVPAPSENQLARSFIGDVERRENARMVCNLLVPNEANENEDEMELSEDSIKYDVAQHYDLDVLPLKEEDAPHATFLLIVDEENGVVSYHPVSSRVNLSSGRPGRRGHTTIKKRQLDEEDIKEIEEAAAEVDQDLAEKHGI